jgi:transposase InsO family protein
MWTYDTSSSNGYVYYVCFIDDFSRKAWIYFLKSKGEVFSKFKEFKNLVENLFEKKIKVLRSDNGGEFTLDEFKAFCGEVGIKRELSTPYNPQQNGSQTNFETSWNILSFMFSGCGILSNTLQRFLSS